LVGFAVGFLGHLLAPFRALVVGLAGVLLAWLWYTNNGLWLVPGAVILVLGLVLEKIAVAAVIA
jgi:hypothetical protein